MLKCRYSGLEVLSCKRSDLCDCFDYPEADEAGNSHDSATGSAGDGRPPGRVT